MSVSMKLESIGPKEAKALLGTQQRNRPLTLNRVAQFCRQMKDGGWQLNGQAIVVDEDGHLLDGQHRLTAVVECGKAIDFLVVRGVKKDSFRTMDTGRGRSAADLVFMGNGVETPHEAKVLATAARLLWRWDREQSLNSRGIVPGVRSAEPVGYEILDLVKLHPELHAACAFGSQKASQVAGWRAGPIAFCYYVCSRIDLNATKTFFGKLVSGAHLDEGDAILKLRGRMAMHSQAKRAMSTVEYVALVFKAWNYFRNKEKVVLLSWKVNETFPKPE